VRRYLLTAIVCGAALSAQGPTSRAPVLIELFTSEGCSSCPPADRLLEQLDSRAIVLSEHVDYWNHDGWKDPWSSSEFTRRQENYERHMGVDGAYTPQMVVDGAVEFNGSDARRAAAEIEKSAQRKKAAVRLARTDAGLQIDVEGATRSTAVYLAFAENATTSQVSAGENSGKRLHHVAVVRSLKKIGTVKRGEAFHKLIETGPDDRARRAVVFLQDGDLGAVSGAAVLDPR
jgi:hypothetical protein